MFSVYILYVFEMLCISKRPQEYGFVIRMMAHKTIMDTVFFLWIISIVVFLQSDAIVVVVVQKPIYLATKTFCCNFLIMQPIAEANQRNFETKRKTWFAL